MESLSVQIMDSQDFEKARSELTGWQALADKALEPNPFHEPWFVLADARRNDEQAQVRFALVKRESETIGVFPFTLRRSYKGLPLRVVSIYQSVFACCGNPLLHRNFARQAMSEFTRWSKKQAHAQLLELNLIGSDASVLNETGLPTLEIGGYSREFLIPRGTDSEAYLQNAFKGSKTGKTIKARRRQLDSMGVVEYDELVLAEDVGKWTDEFLKLESSGWKGKQRTALDCSDSHRKFFTSVIAESFSRGQLWFSALRLDGRPIAMMVTLLGGEGGFIWKTAYDERYSNHSPGFQLQLEKTKRLHAMIGGVPSHHPAHWKVQPKWIDSCIAQDRKVDHAIWSESRYFHGRLIGVGFGGKLFLTLYPSLRLLGRNFRKWAQNFAVGLRRAPT